MPALPPDQLARALASVEVHATAQGGAFTFAQAVAAGFSPAHVRTLVRREAWVRVRRGVFATARRMDEVPHLTACAAKLLRTYPEAVVSHESAWVLYELPYVDPPPEPRLTVPWTRPAVTPYGLGMFENALPPEQVIRFGTVPVTSGARTVVDVLRNAGDRFRAQELADGALGAGVERDLVEQMIDWCAGWPGVAQAREAWQHGDARSESPLESRHRLVFRDAGFPVPELQAKIRDRSGRILARVDFLFRAQATVVESDGRVKYVEDDRPGHRRDHVLWEEKLREDRLRDLGFEVVRATWADAQDRGNDLVERVHRAFGRSARRAA